MVMLHLLVLNLFHTDSDWELTSCGILFTCRIDCIKIIIAYWWIFKFFRVFGYWLIFFFSHSLRYCKNSCSWPYCHLFARINSFLLGHILPSKYFLKVSMDNLTSDIVFCEWKPNNIWTNWGWLCQRAMKENEYSLIIYWRFSSKQVNNEMYFTMNCSKMVNRSERMRLSYF